MTYCEWRNCCDRSHLSCFLSALHAHANYRCSINVYYVIEHMTPRLLLYMNKIGLILLVIVLTWEISWWWKGKQLHWVEDKARLWHQSWPNLRHWLCDSTWDNLVQSSCYFMPDAFRPHMESESCWTISPKWHKYVSTHHLMVMSKKTAVSWTCS